ncbi:DUF3703 domain-containing protein [Shewanella sp. OMA3-2]|uniref:DUF3703 domain-containing protein n=1 Tax=Shewanella sp. OMA3-2 TaxID=2908650 RepID=UPI001F281E9F|nr:DUF3703 domain-containing protein [Shewanella sp. OMA3-2]UJF21705.1 DUF3703 domain-containing protein [Shewanella sp. OMA3-2]
MSSFAKKIRPYVLGEFKSYQICLLQGDAIQAFTHLENAHVLGQQSTYWHVVTHYHMARWAVTQCDIKEFAGQLLRIAGAATKTVFGLVPAGNTGGTNVSPFKPMPLTAEHKKLIAQANVD